MWGKAKIVPGTEALNAGGRAEVTSVACTSSVACTVGGTYQDNGHNYQVFVASTDSMGDWGKATIVPGTPAALKTNGFANLTSLSCTSAGNCVAGGQFSSPDGNQAFVARSTKGVWGKATEVPGVASIDGGANSQVTSISCAAAGNCAAVGVDDAAPYVFVVGQTNGVWGTAVDLPGMSNLGNSNNLSVISCAKTVGTCGIGGSYYNGSATEAFVTTP